MVLLWIIRVARRLHINAIGMNPNTLRTVQILEDFVNGRMLVEVPHGLMLVHLDHARTRLMRPAVPVVRIIGIHL